MSCASILNIMQHACEYMCLLSAKAPNMAARTGNVYSNHIRTVEIFPLGRVSLPQKKVAYRSSFFHFLQMYGIMTVLYKMYIHLNHF